MTQKLLPDSSNMAIMRYSGVIVEILRGANSKMECKKRCKKLSVASASFTAFTQRRCLMASPILGSLRDAGVTKAAV